MKFLAWLLPVLFLFSCSKESNTPQKAFSYSLSGLPDSTLMMLQSDTLEIPLSLVYIEGKKEKLSLMVGGLPVSMTASLSKEIDTPSFISVLRLVTHQTDTGLYDFKITVSDPKETRDFPLKLKVGPSPVNPALDLEGNYKETGPCSISGPLNNTVTIAADLPLFNRITIKGLWNNNNSTVVNAEINPQNASVIFPAQTINGAVFSGSGHYNNQQIFLDYRVDFGTSSDTCSVILSKILPL